MTEITAYITHTWNKKKFDHDPIKVVLKGADDVEENLRIEVTAPLFNDPPNPGGIPGKPFETIWEYEVVEVFLLNEEEKYLEVILSPHGQHYVLIQGGYRNKLKVELPIEYTTIKTESTWSGVAIFPGSYLPPKVTKWNAYAMHGSGDARQFEALHGDDSGRHKPDFHDLSLFRGLDVAKVMPSNWTSDYTSDIWRDYL